MAVFRCVPFDVLVGFVVALVSWSVSWCIGAVPGSTSAHTFRVLQRCAPVFRFVSWSASRCCAHGRIVPVPGFPSLSQWCPWPNGVPGGLLVSQTCPVHSLALLPMAFV